MNITPRLVVPKPSLLGSQAFPPWTIAGNSFRPTPALATVLFLAVVIGLLAVPHAIAAEFSVAKVQQWMQSADLGPIPDGMYPYAFVAQAWTSPEGRLTSAHLLGPEGFETTLVTAGSEALMKEGYADLETLEQTWPDGTWRMTLEDSLGARHEADSSLAAAAFPSAPRFANLPELVALSVSLPHAVKWDPFPGGASADVIEFAIEDLFGRAVLRSPRPGETGALDGTRTEFTIPARALTNGFVGSMRLTFLKASAPVGEPSPSLTAIAGRGASTSYFFFTSNELPPVDLVGWSQLRGQLFNQESSAGSQPVPNPTAGFVFEATAQAVDLGLLSHATVTAPNATVRPLAPAPTPVADTLSFRLSFDTGAAADALFPAGLYRWFLETLNDGQRTLETQLPVVASPPPPRLLEGEALLALSPDSPGLLRWAARGNASSEDRYQLFIETPTGDLVYSTALPFAAAALDGSATEAPLPYLPRGRSFVGRLRFISVAVRDDANYLGAVGLSGNFAETRFPIRTTLGTLAPTAAIEATPLPAGTVGADYSARLQCSDSAPPRAWSLVAGALPPGLRLDPDAGDLWGTPALAGEYAFDIGMTDALQRPAQAHFTISVTGLPPTLALASTNLPPGEAGRFYLAELETAGGVEPFSWRLAPGSTPPSGLNLHETSGLFSGVPTQAGVFDLDFVVTDAAGQTAQARLPLVVAPVPVPVPLAFQAIRRAGERIELELAGEANQIFTLEASANLGHWATVLVTNVPAAGNGLIDLGFANGPTFFRVRRSEPDWAPHPLKVQPRIDLARSVTLEFTQFGGTLALTNQDGIAYHLSLPANAIPEGVPVTMTLVEAVDGLPAGFQFLGGVDLAPDGLILLAPGTLTMEFPGGVPADVTALAWLGEGEQFHLRGSRTDGNRLIFDIRHFTGASAGVAPKAAAATAAAANRPCSIEALLENEVGALLHAWAPELPTPMAWYQVLEHFRAFALIPKIHAAAGDDKQLRAAFRGWWAWKGVIDLGINFDPSPLSQWVENALATGDKDCQRRLGRATTDGLKRIFQRGVSENRPFEAGRMLEVHRQASVFLMNDSSLLPDFAWVADRSARLFRFELEFESRVESNGPKGRMIAQVRSQRVKLSVDENTLLYFPTAGARLDLAQFVPPPPGEDGEEVFNKPRPGRLDVTLFKVGREEAKRPPSGSTDPCADPSDDPPPFVSCNLCFIDALWLWGRKDGNEQPLGDGWVVPFKGLERDRLLSPSARAQYGDLVATTDNAFRFGRADWTVLGRRLFALSQTEKTHAQDDGTVHEVTTVHVYHAPWKRPTP